MSALETPPQPWPQHYFTLAKSLYKQGQHRSFLNQAECQIFESALENFTEWTSFLESNQVAVFRTRAMLAEQLIHSPNNNNMIIQEQDDDEPNSPIPQKNSHDNVVIPILDVYHSLEFDMPAMLEQRRLDHKEQQQLEMKQEEIEEEKVTPILNDSDQFDLKYLLKGISENRTKTSLSDRELRNLLLDIKPHRSKWANDNKIGQEDLYEACEKVLIELKNFTDHSGPFLNKVNKREAPDYHDVISEPMDLGTVSKKLKSFQYKTKKEFSRDLYLIYENCLLYNTHPSSEYRKHAVAMRRKTDRLLTKVPDIEIKEEKQQQAHDDDHKSEDEEDEYEEEKDLRNDEDHAKTEGEDKEEDKEEDEEEEEEEEEAEEEEEEEEEEENHETEINASTKTVYSGKHIKKRRISTHIHEHEDLPDDELENIKYDLQAQTWLDMTKKTRAKVTTDVEKQYQFEFGNRQILTRSSLDMQRFSLFERLHHKPQTIKKLMHYSSNGFSKWVQRNNQIIDDDISSDDEEDHNGSFFFYPPKKKTTNEETSDDLFLPEYVLTSGLPEIEGIMNDINENDLQRSMKSLDINSSTKCPPNSLNDTMEQNIQTLSQIRSIYQKCDVVRKDTPMSSSITKNETMDSPSIYKTPSIKEDDEEATTTIIDIDKKSSEQIVQRSIIQLLTHAGFESAHTNSLNVLTDMMTDYLTNLGKTLRYYWDDHSKEMNGEEIVLHSLYENGINGFSELEDYIVDDVVKAGNRLNDVKRKLEYSFKGLVSSSSDELVNNETMFEDEEILASGAFGEELGEDFFGFKELGIAQEYNMNTLNVPSKLWFGKEIFKKVEKSVSQEHKTKYKVPPPFSKVTKDETFIGLLQPWYTKRLQDHPNLLEDEYLPRNRHKTLYPPVLSAFKSTASNKKRVLKDGSNTQQHYDNRKKRKHEMEELKAEKKRQKLEIKAQKLAEKEQKKKEKEELRLAKKDKKQPIVN